MATTLATVVSLEGQAWAKSVNGSLRPLQVGDKVAPDEVVVTAAGARIELDFGDGYPVIIGGGQEVLMGRDLWTDLATDKQDAAVQDASVQEALTVLNSGGDLTTELEETAAGVMGGSGGDGHSFVQLTRIIETTSPGVFNPGVTSASVVDDFALDTNAINLNHPPLIAVHNFTTDEDAVFNGQILATDSDGDALSYSVIAPPANGTVVVNPATGAFVYTPTANYNGIDSVGISVTDVRGNVTTSTLSFTVNTINDAPVSRDQTFSTEEDSALTGQIIATDIEGDRLSYSLAQVPAHGAVEVDASTGEFVYTPNANFNGNDSFVVTVADGLGGVTTHTMAVSVTAVNDVPVASDQALTTAEAMPIAGSLVATDVDGDSLFYSLTANATHGLVILNLATGSFVYTPDAGYNGSDNFVVTIDDGKGGITTSTISIDVTPVDYAPVISTGSGVVIEDIQPVVTGLLTATDADNASLAFVATTRVGGNGSLELLSNGHWTYTLDSRANALAVGDESSETFVVKLNDGSLTQISIVVSGTNDVPVASNQTLIVTEDIPLLGNVKALDIDGDALSYTLTTDATSGTVVVDVTTGNFVYTPAVNFNGTDSFAITVADGHGGTTTSTITLTVEAVNDAPVAVNNSLSAIEDTPMIFTAAQLISNDTDIELDAVSIASVTSGANGTAELNPDGTVTFTPNVNFNGVADFTYIATDGKLISDTATVSVTVAPVNDAPIAVNSSLSAVEDTSVTYTAAQLLGNATDIDLDAVSIANVTSGANGTAVLNPDGTVRFTPNANFHGVADFIYTATDGSLVSNVATASVAVVAINDAPIAQAASFSISEDAVVVNGSVMASDLDVNAVLSFSLSAPAPAGLTFNTDGSYNFDPSNAAYQSLGLGQSALITVPFTVTDEQGATSTANLVITVNGTNDAPIAQAVSFSVAEDATIVNGSVVAVDVDANAVLTFGLNSAAPAGLTFNSNGTYSFDAANPAYQSLGVGLSSVISVPYTVTDDQGATSSANLIITLNGTNDLPITSNQMITTAEDTAQTGNIIGSDTDGNLLTYSMNSLATHGSVVLDTATGSFTYNPTANYRGTDNFSVNVNDGHGGITSSHISVVVNPVADVPTLHITLEENSGMIFIPMAVPPSVGLISDHFVGIPSVAPANAQNLATVEAAVDAAIATSSSTITDVAYPGISADDAYHIHGYIFLEAGHTYQLAGSRDDTLLVKIGGTTVYSVGFNTWGDLHNGLDENGAFPVAPTPLPVVKSGYYTFEVIIYNGDHGGNLNLDLSVDGQPALDINTTNFNLYTDIATVNSAGALVSHGDGGFYPLLTIETQYHYFSLNVSAALGDTDGSESLALSASGIPVGTTLTDGANMFVAAAGLTSTDVTDWNLANLTVIPATGQTTSFDLTFTATASDGASSFSITKFELLNPADNEATNTAGSPGVDNLSGLSSADAMFGLDADDTLNGNGGGDLFVGGTGNDTMTSSGIGADTFKWDFGDQGTVTTPANDVLINFNTAQGDSLDLSDLLQNEAAANLTQYLHFEISGADTTVSVSSAGAFDGTNYATATDQTIVLSNLNLTGTDTAIIDQLKNNGNLITD